MNAQKLTVLLASLAVMAGAYAAPGGTFHERPKMQGKVGFSYGYKDVGVTVGALKEDSSGFHGGKKGEAGLGLTAISNGKLIGAKALYNLLKDTPVYGVDKNGVATFGSVNKTPAPDDHNGRSGGVLRMAKVAGHELYFGEWSYSGQANDSGHNVYYVGQERATNLPTQGKVAYNVKGINGYSKDGEMLSGTLTADFGAQKLTGTLKNRNLNIAINANEMNTAAAGFVGEAVASGKQAGGKVTGDVRGQFFGNGGSAVGGLATFKTRRDLDTAFGGTKQ